MKYILTFLLFVTTLSYGQKPTVDKIKVFENSNYTVPMLLYKSSEKEKLPLIIYCHGRGEQGVNANILYNAGLPKVLNEGFKAPFEFIMIAPQRSSWSIDPAWLPVIIKEAVARFNIDTNKIFVTGISAGAWGTWGSVLNVSESFANKISGIIPISGAAQDANKANLNWFKTSKTPIWAIVGGNDLSPKEQNEYLVNEANKRAGEIIGKISIRPGVGHTGWNEVYNGSWKENNKTIWDWMSTVMGTTPTPPVIVTPPIVTPPIEDCDSVRNAIIVKMQGMRDSINTLKADYQVLLTNYDKEIATNKETLKLLIQRNNAYIQLDKEFEEYRIRVTTLFEQLLELMLGFE